MPIPGLRRGENRWGRLPWLMDGRRDRRGMIGAFWFLSTMATATLASAGTAAGEGAGDAPPTRVASAKPSETTIPDRSAIAHPATHPSQSEASDEVHPTVKAKQAIAACKANYVNIRDYTCLFIKRERIGGILTSQQEMLMKARAEPLSFYMKFRRPHKGREAIFVTGRNNGKVKAHDVGIGKVIAGTMDLDPKGSMAMESSLHPITEAGIGHLIDTVAHHWSAELKPGESVIHFRENLRIGKSLCTMIESTHPLKHPNYRFYRVRLYIDRENGLPIRFEAYDWPARPGVEGELLEEYTYLDLKTNVGLTDLDFDTRNKAYSFGRF